MLKSPGIALGAGLASALLFIVSAKGTALAVLLAYFTALPVMIAALSFGHGAGLLGAIIGTGTVSLVLGPILGAFFALSFAFPAWWLAYLAQLARPASSVGAEPWPAGPPALAWYPVDRLVIWAVTCAIGAVLLIGCAVLVRFGGYDQTSALLVRRFEAVLRNSNPSDPVDADDLASTFVQILPVAIAASSFFMLMVNLWLAARISRLSDRLNRPWPNIPDGFRLPRALAAVFLLALASSLIQLPVAAITAATVAAGLGLALALQGLATAHVVTRGLTARRGILALVYLVTLLLPLSLVALTLIGIIDCLFPTRFRRAPTSMPAKPLGG